MKIRDSAIAYAASIRIDGPGIKVIPSLAAYDIIIALAGVNTVKVVRQSLARSAVAPQQVIAAKAVYFITAAPPVQPVSGAGALQDVVAGAAVNHSHPVIAAIREIRDIYGACAFHKAYVVVTCKPGDPELLNRRFAICIAPGPQDDHRVIFGIPDFQIHPQLLNALFAFIC